MKKRERDSLSKREKEKSKKCKKIMKAKNKRLNDWIFKLKIIDKKNIKQPLRNW